MNNSDDTWRAVLGWRAWVIRKMDELDALAVTLRRMLAN